MAGGDVGQFRVYKLNPAGKIAAGEWVEAESEEEARSLAHELCDDATPTVELWQGAHCLAVLPCDADHPAA